MGPYLPLLGLTVEHAYFDGAPCASLRFTPSDRSRAWLARAACVVRATPGGFEVCCDGGQLDRLRLASNDSGDPPDLTWWVHAGDPLFGNYTDGLPRTTEAVLAFDSATAVRDAPRAGGPAAAPPATWRLHRAPTAGPADALAPTSDGPGEPWPAGLRRVPPTFVVTLRLTRDAVAPGSNPAAAPQSRLYVVRFAARSPVWKYCLLGDWGSEEVRVVDLAREADFTPAVNESLAGGRDAKAIRSRTGIALCSRSSRRFQLRGVDGNTERVLIKRLPVAGARHLARETIDGTPTWVSEIYVHR
jgi:hypothetical protein